MQIQLTGTNFANSARVYFNGAQSGIQTTVNSSTSLTATLPAQLLGPYGSTDDITVFNTPPGGGKSKAQAFRVAAPPSPNDNIASAINITQLTFTDVEDSSGATAQATDPVPPCAQQFTAAQGNTGGEPNGAYNTIWYTFTPIFSAILEVDTVGSSYDTVLSIWTGTPGSLSLVACNDDITPGVDIQSQISNASLTAGTTYYIMVSTFGPPDPNPLALGGKSVLNFNYNGGFNPQPLTSSISPTSASSGGPGFTLTVNGTSFLPGAYVLFGNNGQGTRNNEATTFVSSTQLTATIQASDILLPGQAVVYAFNPSPSVSSSSGLNFTVNVGTYPVPVLNSISPSTVVAGSLPFTLNVFGADFAPGATLNINGADLKPSSMSPVNMYVTIPSSAIMTPGQLPITAVNPGPGGGSSSPQTLSVTAPTVVPTISSVGPSVFSASTPPITVTVNGSGFISGAYVLFNGNTTYP